MYPRGIHRRTHPIPLYLSGAHDTAPKGTYHGKKSKPKV